MEASNLRARARYALQGNWAIAIAVAAVGQLLGGLLVGSSFLPEVTQEIPIFVSGIRDFFYFLQEHLEEGLRVGKFTFGFRGGIFGLAAFLLGGTLQLGYARFLLKMQDGEKGEFRDLFSQFDRFGTGFAQRFLRNLYVILWSLLLFIPGIVKALAYSMTPFILAEHPELTASQAMERSEAMMDGHKMDLFILSLTFLGWTVLAILTANLGFLLLNPYRNAARAAFYRQLQGQTL